MIIKVAVISTLSLVFGLSAQAANVTPSEMTTIVPTKGVIEHVEFFRHSRWRSHYRWGSRHGDGYRGRDSDRRGRDRY